MKKTILAWTLLLSLTAGMICPVCAEQKEYSWYCTHVKGGEQPPIGQELSFTEDLGAYYIDHNHTSTDADKVIYLTFDAGYENGNITKILDVLKEEQVPAAFFVLGHLITHETALVKRMKEEGHTVCNHTVKHKNMSAASTEDFLRELRTLEDLYRTHVGGELACYYRPPEGRFSRENLIAAKENGYTTVFWSFAYPDWDNAKQMTPEKAKSIILDNLHNGEIMLLHPTSETNAAILGDVIRTARVQGYRFGTLDELTCQN